MDGWIDIVIILSIISLVWLVLKWTKLASIMRLHLNSFCSLAFFPPIVAILKHSWGKTTSITEMQLPIFVYFWQAGRGAASWDDRQIAQSADVAAVPVDRPENWGSLTGFLLICWAEAGFLCSASCICALLLCLVFVLNCLVHCQLKQLRELLSKEHKT